MNNPKKLSLDSIRNFKINPIKFGIRAVLTEEIGKKYFDNKPFKFKMFAVPGGTRFEIEKIGFVHICKTEGSGNIDSDLEFLRELEKHCEKRQ